MTYSKKRTLSYGVILISVLLAYFCRQVRTENVFMRNLADQCRSCIYLGMYCAWVIYLRRHVVHKKTRRCLTAIGEKQPFRITAANGPTLPLGIRQYMLKLS